MTTAIPGPIMDHQRNNPYGVTGTAMAGTTDAAEALRLTGLDFRVTKEPIQSNVLTPDGVDNIPFDDKFATVRHNTDGTRANLGVVGKQYFPIQQDFLAQLLQNIVDSSDGVFQAGGATHRGARTFMQMGMPNDILIGGRDAIKMSLAIFNSHDGTGVCLGVPTAERFFCTNQFAAAKRTITKFSIRHTANSVAAWDIAEIRRALTLTFAYGKELEEIGNVLVQRPMDSIEFGAFVDRYSPVVKHAKTDKELETSALRRATLRQIFTGAENLSAVRNTQWAALQTVMEYEDWFKPVTKGTTHEGRIVARSGDDAKLRAQALLLG